MKLSSRQDGSRPTVLNRQDGSMNILVIPLIMAVIFFVAALGFGLWAFSSRQDYKNNTDAKIAAAVEVAEKQTATEKDNEFIEREKQPLKDYQGPASYGTVSIKYPKTWSAYVGASGEGKGGVDAFFHPNIVPGVQTDSNYALRLAVVNRTYSDELKAFDSSVKKGVTRAVPYKPSNVENIIGTKLSGEIDNNKTGVIILVPLRDKTIKIWTEGDQYVKDFNENILHQCRLTWTNVVILHVQPEV